MVKEHFYHLQLKEKGFVSRKCSCDNLSPSIRTSSKIYPLNKLHKTTENKVKRRNDMFNDIYYFILLVRRPEYR